MIRSHSHSDFLHSCATVRIVLVVCGIRRSEEAIDSECNLGLGVRAEGSEHALELPLEAGMLVVDCHRLEVGELQ